MATTRTTKKKQKEADKDLSKTYNEFKEFEGKLYTGMKIGRSHRWYYDKGEWIETKVTPDLWTISYAVTKRRKGKAPEGSGVPVGTEYHWYILAHQNVRKLDANSYTTSLTGLKYKLAHKRADKDKWSVSEKTQKKHLIKILQNLIEQLQREPENIKQAPATKKVPQPKRAAASRKVSGRTSGKTRKKAGAKKDPVEIENM